MNESNRHQRTGVGRGHCGVGAKQVKENNETCDLALPLDEPCQMESQTQTQQQLYYGLSTLENFDERPAPSLTLVTNMKTQLHMALERNSWLQKRIEDLEEERDFLRCQLDRFISSARLDADDHCCNKQLPRRSEILEPRNGDMTDDDSMGSWMATSPKEGGSVEHKKLKAGLNRRRFAKPKIRERQRDFPTATRLFSFSLLPPESLTRGEIVAKEELAAIICSIPQSIASWIDWL